MPQSVAAYTRSLEISKGFGCMPVYIFCMLVQIAYWRRPEDVAIVRRPLPKH